MNLQICGNFQHLEPINMLKEKADWYLVVEEGDDEEGDTKKHWHFAMRTTQYSRIASVKRAIKDKFPEFCNKNTWCIKTWKDDGYLAYICKGDGEGQLPRVTYKHGLDIDTDKWHKLYYAKAKIKPVDKAWLDAIVAKYAGQEWEEIKYEVFKDVYGKCPCPTKFQVIAYCAKVRRAINEEEGCGSLWKAVCDDTVFL